MDSTFRKSSKSSPSCDNCVEVAQINGNVVVRHSKDQEGATLTFTPGEWDAFVEGVKDNEFNL